MHGPAMRRALRTLSDRFEQVAMPEGGRYTPDPQRAEDGSAYRPA